MALAPLQRAICRLLAERRLAAGDSYLAVGATLNELLRAPRISRDLDPFHDTAEALERSWEEDRGLLAAAGFDVVVVRERPSFVEAEVRRGGEAVLMEWARDSAYRFFPLLEHDQLGLVLHPFDLATNKVLALVGRLEVRGFVDVIESSRRLQPLGYLAWAAAGKDPGFSPAAILEQARRSARYSREEVEALSFGGPPPDPGALAREWRSILAEADEVVRLLPAAEVGTCVLAPDQGLFRGDPGQLRRALEAGEVTFHPGRIGGALPELLVPARI